MTFTPPGTPSACPESQEALSRRHAPDTFALRVLDSGRLAFWDSHNTFLGIADTFEEVLRATDHLRLTASAERLNREAAACALARRAEEAAILDDLEIEL